MNTGIHLRQEVPPWISSLYPRRWSFRFQTSSPSWALALLSSHSYTSHEHELDTGVGLQSCNIYGIVCDLIMWEWSCWSDRNRDEAPEMKDTRNGIVRTIPSLEVGLSMKIVFIRSSLWFLEVEPFVVLPVWIGYYYFLSTWRLHTFRTWGLFQSWYIELGSKYFLLKASIKEPR